MPCDGARVAVSDGVSGLRKAQPFLAGPFGALLVMSASIFSYYPGNETDTVEGGCRHHRASVAPMPGLCFEGVRRPVPPVVQLGHIEEPKRLFQIAVE
jgi:hypothetical protein